MKQLILLAISTVILTRGFAQNAKAEKVDWNALQSFSAKQIEFKSNEITMKCTDCKYVEIVTASGLNGLFLIGNGTIQVKAGNISDSISGCLIRFNPGEFGTYIRMVGKKKIDDRGFSALSKNVLNDSFSHCYQGNLDAIIPPKGSYALNFFSKSLGEILATYTETEASVINFTEKKIITKSPFEDFKK